jgi:hypothetical protein
VLLCCGVLYCIRTIQMTSGPRKSSVIMKSEHLVAVLDIHKKNTSTTCTIECVNEQIKLLCIRMR